MKSNKPHSLAMCHGKFPKLYNAFFLPHKNVLRREICENYFSNYFHVMKIVLHSFIFVHSIICISLFDMKSKNCNTLPFLFLIFVAVHSLLNCCLRLHLLSFHFCLHIENRLFHNDGSSLKISTHRKQVNYIVSTHRHINERTISIQ